MNLQIYKPNLVLLLYNPEKITSGFIFWFWDEHAASAEEAQRFMQRKIDNTCRGKKYKEVILLFVSYLEVKAYFILCWASLMIQTVAEPEHVEPQTGFWNTAPASNFLKQLRKWTQMMLFLNADGAGDPKKGSNGDMHTLFAILFLQREAKMM